jgi:hypothetical protein
MTATLEDQVAEPPQLTGTKRVDVRSAVFTGALWACLLIAALFLMAVLLVIVINGLARLDGSPGVQRGPSVDKSLGGQINVTRRDQPDGLVTQVDGDDQRWHETGTEPIPARKISAR